MTAGNKSFLPSSAVPSGCTAECAAKGCVCVWAPKMIPTRSRLARANGHQHRLRQGGGEGLKVPSFPCCLYHMPGRLERRVHIYTLTLADLPLSCLASPHPVCYFCVPATVSGSFCLHPAPHPLHTHAFHAPTDTSISSDCVVLSGPSKYKMLIAESSPAGTGSNRIRAPCQGCSATATRQEVLLTQYIVAQHERGQKPSACSHPRVQQHIRLP